MRTKKKMRRAAYSATALTAVVAVSSLGVGAAFAGSWYGPYLTKPHCDAQRAVIGYPQGSYCAYQDAPGSSNDGWYMYLPS